MTAYGADERAERLARDSADAASRSGNSAEVAAIVGGATLTALRGEAVEPLARQFLYFETRLSFLEAGALPTFQPAFGQPPSILDGASSLGPKWADIAVVLRDKYLALWRASGSDKTERLRGWLAAASFFALLTEHVRETQSRDAGSDIAASRIGVGLIQQDLGGRETELTKALAAFQKGRAEATALAAVDADFSSSAHLRADGVALTNDAYGVSGIQALAPVALAASGAEAARIGLEKHDAAAARQGLDVLNGALAEMDAAGRQLTAAWACAPALIEGRLWHARADALSARLARLTGGAEADRLDSDADREFRATLVLSLYSRGGNEDFRNARDAYLVFMREAVRDSVGTEKALAALDASEPGSVTPVQLRDALICGR